MKTQWSTSGISTISTGVQSMGKNLTEGDIVLAISGYESMFLADLVASYVFETAGEEFKEVIFERERERQWVNSMEGTMDKEASRAMPQMFPDSS
eukprot:10438316-Ditylum_brightwellii.AAC.1